jgi:lipoprotein-anchoring transpeptidase ErfK/SrfK
MLAGGIGAGALIALPDVSLAGRAAAASARSASPAGSGSGYVLLYGTPESTTAPGGSAASALSPAPRARSRTAAPSLPAARPVATQLTSAPVASADQSSVALVTVDTVPSGAKVTLTVVDAATAVISKQGSLTITGIAEGTSILPTPVFAPGTAIIAVVLAITEPVDRRAARKVDFHTGRSVPMQAVTWRSRHALAYFDQASETFAGPFHLGNAPSLALTTAAANSSDLFLWTTKEPQPALTRPQPPPLPWVSVFPLGSGQPRASVPSPAPWPAGEPVVTLSTGEVSRLVHGRAVQVSSAQTGEVTHRVIEPLNVTRAKPSAVTMEARPDGTVFLTKPGVGQAVVADPAQDFRVTAKVSYPAPATPLGAPWSKAVLSPEGDTLYVLGGAKAGGISAYDMATGKLARSYSHGRKYYGLYQLSSGVLLTLSPQNPRLEFFSPHLSPLGTAATNLHVSAVF